MVKVTIGTTMENRPAEVFDANVTVEDVLNKFTSDTGVDWHKGSWNINGFVITDFGKSFKDMGYDGKEIFLLNVVNSKNAA